MDGSGRDSDWEVKLSQRDAKAERRAKAREREEARAQEAAEDRRRAEEAKKKKEKTPQTRSEVNIFSHHDKVMERMKRTLERTEKKVSVRVSEADRKRANQAAEKQEAPATRAPTTPSNPVTKTSKKIGQPSTSTSTSTTSAAPHGGSEKDEKIKDTKRATKTSGSHDANGKGRQRSSSSSGARSASKDNRKKRIIEEEREMLRGGSAFSSEPRDRRQRTRGGERRDGDAHGDAAPD